MSQRKPPFLHPPVSGTEDAVPPGPARPGPGTGPASPRLAGPRPAVADPTSVNNADSTCVMLQVGRHSVAIMCNDDMNRPGANLLRPDQVVEFIPMHPEIWVRGKTGTWAWRALVTS